MSQQINIDQRQHHHNGIVEIQSRQQGPCLLRHSLQSLRHYTSSRNRHRTPPVCARLLGRTTLGPCILRVTLFSASAGASPSFSPASSSLTFFIETSGSGL